MNPPLLTKLQSLRAHLERNREHDIQGELAAGSIANFALGLLTNSKYLAMLGDLESSSRCMEEIARRVRVWKDSPRPLLPFTEPPRAGDPVLCAPELTSLIMEYFDFQVRWRTEGRFPVGDSARIVAGLEQVLSIREHPLALPHELPIFALQASRTEVALKWMKRWWPTNRNWSSKGLFRGRHGQQPQGFIIYAARRLAELQGASRADRVAIVAMVVAELLKRADQMPAIWSGTLMLIAFELECVRRLISGEETSWKAIAASCPYPEGIPAR